MTISFSTFLEHAGLDGTIKIVRHKAKIDVVERYFEDPESFSAYHSLQSLDVFKGADFLAEFGAMRGSQAMFLGVWKVIDTIPGSGIPRRRLTKSCRLEDRFLLRVPKKPPNERVPAWFYILEQTHYLDEYSGRLVIDWGTGTRAWVQRKLDKPVVSLRESQKATTLLKPFKGYSAARLSFQELQRLAADPGSNKDWQDALAVDGVYVIADRRTGNLYVGSAYGDGGILGRWLSYAKNGHGGNQELRSLNPDFFQFVVLRPMPDAAKHEVLGAESEWKRNLLSREFGLNLN